MAAMAEAEYRWALRHISIENFKSIAKAELTITAQAFHLVTGPNGSGKSNLFEAIAFGLGQPVTPAVFRVGCLAELAGAGSNSRHSRVCVDLVFERQPTSPQGDRIEALGTDSTNTTTTATAATAAAAKVSSSSRKGVVRSKAAGHQRHPNPPATPTPTCTPQQLSVGSRYVAGSREYLLNGAKVTRARWVRVSQPMTCCNSIYIGALV
jgi:energy-coupling factor transporter ATP-binding protein EcfA2